MPKVSIIVPCWGVEKYLDRCVESLVNQTLKDIEIILVDDESPDRVPEMCDKWAKKDNRIKVIHKKNGGLGMACNSGLEVANGEYVAFCDSDDWVDAEMYEKLFEEAICQNSDMVFSGLKRVDSEGKPCGTLPHLLQHMVIKGKANICELARDIIASAPSERVEHKIQMSAKVVLYKKSVIDHNSIRFVSEREIPSEDLHFNLDVLAISNVVCVLPYYFYNYRVNPASITGKSKFGTYNKNIIRYEYTLRECNHLQIGGDYKIRCQRMLIAYTRSHICSIFRSNMLKKDKIKEVESVCSNRVLKIIMQEYPANKMPIVHRLFFYAVKYRLYYCMNLFAKIKS